MHHLSAFVLFFFNDTATTEIYTLSLHDALPISMTASCITPAKSARASRRSKGCGSKTSCRRTPRSEEHTSELQSQSNLVCRLLLEKKQTCFLPALRPLTLGRPAA